MMNRAERNMIREADAEIKKLVAQLEAEKRENARLRKKVNDLTTRQLLEV